LTPGKTRAEWKKWKTIKGERKKGKRKRKEKWEKEEGRKMQLSALASLHPSIHGSKDLGTSFNIVISTSPF